MSARVGQLHFHRGAEMMKGLGLILAVVVGFLGNSGHSARAAEPSAKLNALIAACAAEYGLPEILLHRVIKQESNTTLRSTTVAIGV